MPFTQEELEQQVAQAQEGFHKNWETNKWHWFQLATVAVRCLIVFVFRR